MTFALDFVKINSYICCLIRSVMEPTKLFETKDYFKVITVFVILFIISAATSGLCSPIPEVPRWIPILGGIIALGSFIGMITAMHKGSK